jgi:hypothetical protein
VTTDDALDEASELRRLLVGQIKRNDELTRENATLRSMIAATVFDLDKAGRVASSTENALRVAAQKEGK